jgi:hypothetical protein
MERFGIDNPLSKMPKLVFGTVQANLELNIKRALGLNYRHIDCASGYANVHGDSNEYYDILKDALKTIPRNQIWLTWKSDSITINNIRSIIDRLQCSYIDLFLNHHSCGTDADFAVYKLAVEQKLIRFYGVSNCEDIRQIRDIKTRHNIFANQIQISSPNGKIYGRRNLRPDYNFNDFIRESNRLGVALMFYGSVSAYTNAVGNKYGIDFEAMQNSMKILPSINPYYLHKYIFDLPIPISEPITIRKLLRYINNLRFSFDNPNSLMVSSMRIDSNTLAKNMEDFNKISVGNNLLTYSEFISVEDILEEITLEVV